MAAKRKKAGKRRGGRRKSRTRGGLGQRLLVGLAGVVLVLCAASITQGFIFRSIGERTPGDPFQIEVLNGTGKHGLAQAAKRSLHRRGIDVIEVGNAKSFDYAHSVLIARKRGVDVDKLGAMLRCTRIVEQIDDRMPDATLILGDDYRDLDLDWKLESDLLE
jgi:hypothetical protein